MEPYPPASFRTTVILPNKRLLLGCGVPVGIVNESIRKNLSHGNTSPICKVGERKCLIGHVTFANNSPIGRVSPSHRARTAVSQVSPHLQMIISFGSLQLAATSALSFINMSNSSYPVPELSLTSSHSLNIQEHASNASLPVPHSPSCLSPTDYYPPGSTSRDTHTDSLLSDCGKLPNRHS